MSQSGPIPYNDLYFLANAGGTGLLIREHDWTGHPLGEPATWPLALKNSLAMLLSSRFPICLWWGSDFYQFYNDAFLDAVSTTGKRLAIGEKGQLSWQESWATLGPLLQRVRHGEAIWCENQDQPVFTGIGLDDISWAFSCSPVYNDNGIIEGVIVLCSETMQQARIRKSLSQSEKRFESLIHEAAIGIVVLDGADHIVDIANNAYLRLVGKTAEELLDKPLFEVLPEAAPYFKGIIDKTLQEGRPQYLTEYPYTLTDGDKKSEGFLNLIYQPHSRDGETCTGVMVLCHDVTQQVVAQRKLAESEVRVRSIINSAPFPIGVYQGEEMNIILANETIMQVWGKGKEIVGRSYFEVLPELENQDIYPELRKVYETGEPYHARNQQVDLVVGGELQRYYFNYSFTPLYDAQGQIYGVMNTAADVTDLVMAKQKVEQGQENFRSLILQAPVAMCLMLGPEHTVEVANEPMITLWGKSRKDVMNMPIFEALPDAREQGLEELLQHVYTSGETFTASEMAVHLVRFGQPDVVYQNFVYEPYRDGTGTIQGVIAISNNVTEQVLARQRIEELVAARTRELEVTNNALKKSNDDLAQFAYIASHDLQEPLRKISVFCQMIAARSENGMDNKSSELLGKISGAASRMQSLVQDVLAYSQLSSAGISFARVNLNHIIGNILNDFELRVEQLAASIEVGALPEIEAQPLQMTQLFSNLISNALKFKKAAVSPVIIIDQQELSESDRLLIGPSADSYIKIAVQDNGIGFKPAFSEKIFTIFQRLHSKSDYEGTGIGLAICKKIILNHHGVLYAEGQQDVGATFSILLPRHQNPA